MKYTLFYILLVAGIWGCSEEQEVTEHGTIYRLNGSSYRLAVADPEGNQVTLEGKLAEAFDNPKGDKMPYSLAKYLSLNTTCGNIKFYEVQNAGYIFCGNCEEYAAIYPNCPLNLKDIAHYRWRIAVAGD